MSKDSVYRVRIYRIRKGGLTELVPNECGDILNDIKNRFPTTITSDGSIILSIDGEFSAKEIDRFGRMYRAYRGRGKQYDNKYVIRITESFSTQDVDPMTRSRLTVVYRGRDIVYWLAGPGEKYPEMEKFYPKPDVPEWRF